MNSLPLRKLIRKYGNLGYALVGCYLLGYWLFRFKRRQTFAVLTLALLAASFSMYRNVQASNRILCALPSGYQSAASYTIRDLGVVKGYEYSFGQSLNAKGQTTGLLADAEFEKLHGFFCSSGGGMTDIGTLGGDFSFTYGINDDGQVVGTSLTDGDDVRGFVWQNGRMTHIGTLGGEFSFAEAINNKGQAAFPIPRRACRMHSCGRMAISRILAANVPASSTARPLSTIMGILRACLPTMVKLCSRSC